MFYLTGFNNERRSIILHVRGFSDGARGGLVNNEGIFLTERRVDPQNPGEVNMQIIRRVGTVHAGADGVSFTYTDEDFKRSINYQEATGYSTMDGASWTVMATNYGPDQGTLRPRDPGLFMYVSANNPMMQIAPTQRFFQTAAPTFGPQRPERQDDQERQSHSLT